MSGPPDDALLERVRRQVAERSGVSERPMFGTAAFFVNGNLGCGVRQRELLIRVPPEHAGAAARAPGARAFENGGRVMRGWMLLDPAGAGGPRAASRWIDRAMNYAASLPAKVR